MVGALSLSLGSNCVVETFRKWSRRRFGGHHCCGSAGERGDADTMDRRRPLRRRDALSTSIGDGMAHAIQQSVDLNGHDKVVFMQALDLFSLQ